MAGSWNGRATGESPDQERWHMWAAWERGSAQGPWQRSLQLSSQNHKLNLPLYDSSLIVPPPEPRVSGHKWDFLCWPFKRVPGFLAVSILTKADKFPTDFQSDIMWAPLPSTNILGWGAQGGVEIPCSSRGPFASEVFSWILNTQVCDHPLLCVSAVPPRLDVASVYPLLCTSTHLVCSWLFRLIVL